MERILTADDRPNGGAPKAAHSAQKEVSLMSGGDHTRFITFSEVNLGPGWSSLNPDNEGFVTYNHPPASDPHAADSSITITRSDGKVLSFVVGASEDFQVQIGENVISYEAGPDEPAGRPFQ